MCCTNCGKELPAGAEFCPGCGTRAPAHLEDEAAQYVREHGLECPQMPEDLSIGRRLLRQPAATAMFREEQNPQWERCTEKVVCTLHKHGICIYFPMGDDIRIHYSQLIDELRYEERASSVGHTEQSNNPIGRAILGGILFGPVGAVVGAASGIGTEKVKETDHIVIYLWDARSKEPCSLLLRGRFEEKSFRRFIEHANKELRKYRERLSPLVVP